MDDYSREDCHEATSSANVYNLHFLLDNNFSLDVLILAAIEQVSKAKTF